MDKIYGFINNSPLLTFINKSLSTNLKFYSIVQILYVIAETVRKHHLLDKANTSIIICNEELELALQVRALCIIDLTMIVKRQLIEVNDRAFTQIYKTKTSVDKLFPPYLQSQLLVPPVIPAFRCPPPGSLYTMSVNLCRILGAPCTPYNVFSWRQASQLLVKFFSYLFRISL